MFKLLNLALRLLTARPEPTLTPSSSFSETELGGVYEQVVMIGHSKYDVSSAGQQNHAFATIGLVGGALRLPLPPNVIGHKLFVSAHHAVRSSGLSTAKYKQRMV